MAEETTNRNSKDSVFVSLFDDKNYVYQLYRELHPEDTDVVLEDIQIKTLESVLINTLYNDLGFVVKDRFIILVEAQSAWCPNIPLRMMFYLSQTYRQYLEETQQSEHSSVKVKLPKPDLYVVYSGKNEVPDEISLRNDFFGGDSPVEIKVKVLHTVDETIYGQYIGFCRIFDEQRKIYQNKLDCAKETIRICVENHYLAAYLKQHETEAISMMSKLFDEEYLRKQYEIAEGRRQFAAGEAIGVAKGEAKLALELLRLGLLSKEDIQKASGLSMEKINELAASV